MHIVLSTLISIAGQSAVADEPDSSPIYSLPDPLGSDDFLSFDSKQAGLGQLLFYDRILSGNKNIACSTCHHHKFGGSDGLSLGIGEGGIGLGTERTAGEGDNRIKKRIPRNAPALWNLAAKEVKILFHDGRLSVSDVYGNGFNSPAEEWLPEGFNSLLAAQALLPLTAQFEMAGNPKENEVAGAAHDRIDKVWPIIAKRVRTIPAYGKMFVDAFEHIELPAEVTIVEVANALAAFMGTEWRNYDSPFDDHLAGDHAALNNRQRNGLQLFYGKARCASCHAGPLLTDHNFHALALPPFGPGRTRRFDPYARDVGRMGESDVLEDAYRFRTPSLRNVELTGPYGHNGAYSKLEDIIRHHLNPQDAFDQWSPADAQLASAPWLSHTDFVVRSDAREMKRIRSTVDIEPLFLSDIEIDDLVQFMLALTGRSARHLPLGVPSMVPSGLAVD